MAVYLTLFFFFVFCFDFSRCEETEEEALFYSWKMEHNKVYENTHEESRRFKSFRDNLADINMRNHQNKVLYGGKGAHFGLNEYSDLSFEEFSQRFLSPIPVDTLKQNYKSNHDINSLNKAVVPKTMDWRDKYQTAIKNQKQCGSCWAFGASELAESAFLWKNKKIEPLSQQQLVDCSTEDGQGCKGQSVMRTIKYIQNVGLVSDEAYPYLAVSSSCKKEILNSTSRSRILNSGSYSIPALKESGLASLANERGPVIFLVAVDKPFQNYRGGIMRAQQCNNPPFNSSSSLNHMLQITGWDLNSGNETVPHWIFRNSWGGSWGEKGQIRMSYAENTCYIAQGTAYWATL